MTQFEKVIELIDWYDGPREGVANFQGRPHAFKSRMLDVYGDDDTIDLFDLTPLSGNLPDSVASAEFRRIGSGPGAGAGEWPTLEVRWSKVG